MSVIDRLSSSLGRRDEAPNKELARELAEQGAADDIRKLVVNLQNPDRRVQSDCIKVLYEIGGVAPERIADYADDFLALLASKNNRMVWGGMSALATIADLRAPVLYGRHREIEAAIDKGSVITADRGIRALSRVAAQDGGYRDALFPYLLAHLKSCRPKDAPQRAEAVLAAVDRENRDAFVEVIDARMGEMRPTQEKRLRKVIAAAEKR